MVLRRVRKNYLKERMNRLGSGISVFVPAGTRGNMATRLQEAQGFLVESGSPVSSAICLVCDDHCVQRIVLHLSPQRNTVAVGNSGKE
jgi:hypothetical protein